MENILLVLRVLVTLGGYPPGHVCLYYMHVHFIYASVLWHFRIRPMTPLFFCSVQSLSHVRLFVTQWTAARQASLSITNSRSLLRLMSVESVMPSSHLILCCPLLLPSNFPSVRVFPHESVVRDQVTKVLKFQLQHQSFRWIFRIDFL